MENKKKGSLLKDAFALFLVTLVSALALSFVYELTKGPIAEQEEKKKNAATAGVFPDASSETDAELTELAIATDLAIFDSKYKTVKINEIKRAYDKDNNTLGHIIQVTNPGYKADITILFGYGSDGTIKGLQFIALNETAGLGSNANTPEFIAKFVGKNVEKFTVTTSGAKEDSQIDAIASSTITTEAVVNAVNGAIAFMKGHDNMDNLAPAETVVAYPEVESVIDEELTALATSTDLSVFDSKYKSVKIKEVRKATDAEGNQVGYILQVSAPGYNEDIILEFGYSADGMVKGIEFIHIKETNGLGMKATELDFMKKFVDKSVEKFKVVFSAPASDEEIDAIASSTITTEAIVNAVNGGLAFIKSHGNMEGLEPAPTVVAYPEVEASINEELTALAASTDLAAIDSKFKNVTINEVKNATDAEGNQVGYILQATVPGYAEDIVLAFGYSNEGMVKGIEFLSIAETNGLGMKATEIEFMQKFVDKSVDQFKVVQSPSTTDGEIDSIASATITTDAIVNAVNAGLSFLKDNVDLGGAANE